MPLCWQHKIVPVLLARWTPSLGLRMTLTAEGASLLADARTAFENYFMSAYVFTRFATTALYKSELVKTGWYHPDIEMIIPQLPTSDAAEFFGSVVWV